MEGGGPYTEEGLRCRALLLHTRRAMLAPPLNEQQRKLACIAACMPGSCSMRMAQIDRRAENGGRLLSTACCCCSPKHTLLRPPAAAAASWALPCQHACAED